MLKRFIALVVIAIGFVVSAAAEPVSTKVTLKAGQMVGVVSGDILSFKGIPYAQPRAAAPAVLVAHAYQGALRV